MSTKIVNLYAVLGVPPASTQEQMHEKYKKLAVKYHPDVGGDGRKFAEITAAWSVLKDPARRHLYDGQLMMLGDPCKKCNGKGLEYRQKSYSTREISKCKACKGIGYL